MKKAIIIIVALLAVIVVAGIVVLSPGGTAKALLYPDGSDVQVNTGKGWIPATDEMELAVGSAIKTGADTATVVLLEGELVMLQPNTEISLTEISKKAIKITQNAGETLNKITKLSGIQSYTVESPSTVATVRGTTFFYSDEEVVVEDGEVMYGPLSQIDKLKVGAGKKSNKGTFTLQDQTAADRARFEQLREKQINALKRIREREISKHGTVLKFAEAQGYNAAKREELLNQVDSDPTPKEDEVLKQVPAPLRKTADRTYRLTKEIKKVRAARAPSGTTAPTPTGTTALKTCASPTGCRTYDAECGGKGSERLWVEGTYQKCVDATKAATERIDYCGRTPLASGDRACNYMTNDYREKSLCVCPAHS